MRVVVSLGSSAKISSDPVAKALVAANRRDRAGVAKRQETNVYLLEALDIEGGSARAQHTRFYTGKSCGPGHHEKDAISMEATWGPGLIPFLLKARRSDVGTVHDLTNLEVGRLSEIKA